MGMTRPDLLVISIGCQGVACRDDISEDNTYSRFALQWDYHHVLRTNVTQTLMLDRDPGNLSIVGGRGVTDSCCRVPHTASNPDVGLCGGREPGSAFRGWSCRHNAGPSARCS